MGICAKITLVRMSRASSSLVLGLPWKDLRDFTLFAINSSAWACDSMLSCDVSYSDSASPSRYLLSEPMI